MRVPLWKLIVVVASKIYRFFLLISVSNYVNVSNYLGQILGSPCILFTSISECVNGNINGMLKKRGPGIKLVKKICK